MSEDQLLASFPARLQLPSPSRRAVVLPTELLSTIFRLTAPRDIGNRLTICAICSRWCALALEDPVFWATSTWEARFLASDRRLALFQRSLELARDAALVLEIEDHGEFPVFCRTYISAVELVGKQSHRLRFLRLVLNYHMACPAFLINSVGFPLLEQFSLVYRPWSGKAPLNISLGSVPRLRSLFLHNAVFKKWNPAFVPTLREFSIISVKSTVPVRALAWGLISFCPCLESLDFISMFGRVELAGNGAADHWPTKPLPPNLSLKRLKLKLATPVALSLLRALSSVRIRLLVLDMECTAISVPNDFSGDDIVAALGAYAENRPFTHLSVIARYFWTRDLPPSIVLCFRDAASTCIRKFATLQDEGGPYCSNILHAAWMQYQMHDTVSEIRLTATLWSTLANLSQNTPLTAPTVELIVEFDGWADLRNPAPVECRYLKILHCVLYGPCGNDTSELRDHCLYKLMKALRFETRYAILIVPHTRDAKADDLVEGWINAESRWRIIWSNYVPNRRRSDDSDLRMSSFEY